MEFGPEFTPDRIEKNKEHKESKKDETHEMDPEVESGDPQVETLEKANLDPETKRNLLLVLMGEKPVTRLGGYVELGAETEEGQKKEKRAENHIKEIERTLDSLDLPFEVNETIKKKDGKRKEKRIEFLAGKDEESVEKIKKTKENPTKYEKEAGKLYGYPPTAVEAYAKGEELIESGKVKKILRKEEEGLENFVNFRLSKDNLEEEIEFIKKQKELIKEISPQIHQEIKESD